MITRKRIKISEKLVALMWQQLTGRELITEEGRRVKGIYPGRTNDDSGPDFRDVLITMDESNLLKGDVEIHVNSSDWYSHGHHNDPEYNGVILHVAMWHDCNSVTSRQDGKLVPLLCLSKALRHQAYLMPYHELPCFQITKRRDKKSWEKLLSIAGEERFKQKVALFQTRLQQEEAMQVFFQSMMRALGYSKNMLPFEELAHRIRLSFVEKLESRESLFLKQAWLLGMAGLLSSQRLKREIVWEREIKELEQIWQSVGRGVKTMSERDWNFSHIYPNNSPVRRIIAQSYLLQRYHESGLLAGILQLIRKTPLNAGYRKLEDGLIVFGDGYRRNHFDFDAGAKTENSALLGRSKASEIIVNAILPFTFSWGEMAGEPELKEKAINFYAHYPKLAENEITRHMTRQLCLEGSIVLTACRQQGLIHIFRNYCREGRCGDCPLVN